MKGKRFLSCLMALGLSIGAFVFVGCDGEPTLYTIQYVDDSGTHTLTVESGALYSLESLPERFGYTFKGLYDARQDGTMYVDEDGHCVTVFADNQNIVLYPQFVPKSYTLVLDYQGAEITGERSKTVRYDEFIGELPSDITLANKNFKGWYTQPNCQGTQIADKDGVLPTRNVLTEATYDLSDENGYVYLYAGFENVRYNVTFHFGNGNSETMEIEHGTDIRNVVTETRVNGNAVLSWSETDGGETVFTGTITSAKTLYAVEYAPVIDFNVNGGETVTPLVARAGSIITLPTPTRENWRFMGWKDADGNAYETTTMPESSITLLAAWQPMLVFDENGGLDVSDICVAAGESITLPAPTKEGFIFAGWYTADREKFERSTMPNESLALKAGWYVAKTGTKVVLSSSQTVETTHHNMTFKDELVIDLSEFLPDNFNAPITFVAKWSQKDTSASEHEDDDKNVVVSFYTQRITGSAYYIGGLTTRHTHANYIAVEKSITTNLSGNKIYTAIASTGTSLMGWVTYGGEITNFRVDITYPDTTNLYL